MYNQYSPYGYPQGYGNYSGYPQRNYAPQPQQMAQPQAQPQMPQQIPFDSPFSEIKFVTEKQAEAYMTFPNTKVLLLDNEKGVAHVKTADAMGQCTTQYFKFVPINADGTPLKAESPQPTLDLSDYLKWSDLGKLGLVTTEQFRSVQQQIDALQKQLIGGRQNVAPRTPQQ